MTDVWIVAVNHFLQEPRDQAATTEGQEVERTQKKAFTDLLKSLHVNQAFNYVGEEGSFAGESIPQRLAAEWRCEYSNITMPLDERERRGIHRYEGDPELAARAFAEFEAYMCEQVNGKRGDGSSILIVCGADHILGLAKHFVQLGDIVHAQDLTKATWYRGRAVESASVEGIRFVGAARNEAEERRLIWELSD